MVITTKVGSDGRRYHFKDGKRISKESYLSLRSKATKRSASKKSKRSVSKRSKRSATATKRSKRSVSKRSKRTTTKGAKLHKRKRPARLISKGKINVGKLLKLIEAKGVNAVINPNQAERIKNMNGIVDRLKLEAVIAEIGVAILNEEMRKPKVTKHTVMRAVKCLGEIANMGITSTSVKPDGSMTVDYAILNSIYNKAHRTSFTNMELLDSPLTKFVKLPVNYVSVRIHLADQSNGLMSIKPLSKMLPMTATVKDLISAIASVTGNRKVRARCVEAEVINNILYMPLCL